MPSAAALRAPEPAEPGSLQPLTAHIGDDYAVLLAPADTTDRPTARVFDLDYALQLAAAPLLTTALRNLLHTVGLVGVAAIPEPHRRPLIAAMSQAGQALAEADGFV